MSTRKECVGNRCHANIEDMGVHVIAKGWFHRRWLLLLFLLLVVVVVVNQLKGLYNHGNDGLCVGCWIGNGGGSIP